MTRKMLFDTHGILSVTTGRLMGDIGAVYEVISYLIGRPAYTHELSHYRDAASAALLTRYHGLPDAATRENWQEVRDKAIEKFGAKMALDPALDGILADDKDPITTLREMGYTGEVVLIGGCRKGDEK